MFVWDDLRHFLAVARGGSTIAAARILNVSQPTVARRIAALERAIGLGLFDRRQAGSALTADGEALLVHAEQVEAAVVALDDTARARSRTISGIVKLSAHEIFAATILPPILRDLHAAYPAIRIELDTSDAVRDIAAGEADIALRSSIGLSGGGLAGRCVADDEWTIYCSRDYAAEHGLPDSAEALHGHPVIGGGGALVWPDYQDWLRATGTEATVAMEHGSVTGMLNAVRAGFGLAQLPCLVADLDPDLVQCFAVDRPTGRRLWLVTHERLRRIPQVRIVLDFLAEQLAMANHRSKAKAAANLAVAHSEAGG
jgi:DNA-binding transcriptional LysR family regulator